MVVEKPPSDAATLSHAANTLYSSGVVGWRGAVSDEGTQTLREAAKTNFEQVRRQLLVVEAMGRTEDADVDSLALGGFHEMVARDGGRYDMRYQMDQSPFADPEIIYNPSWFPLIREVLGEEVCLLYTGVMIAAGAKTSEERKVTAPPAPQKWHGDGEPNNPNPEPTFTQTQALTQTLALTSVKGIIFSRGHTSLRIVSMSSSLSSVSIIRLTVRQRQQGFPPYAALPPQT